MLKINIEQWDAVINQSYQVEFDWIGIDSLDQIAIFSSFNKGHIPHIVKSSFELYKQLFALIDKFPRFTTAVLVTKENGVFNDWLVYSQKGLYAFDYQDVHRENKFNQYDLISKPVAPLIINQVKNIELYLSIIPRFNLVFNDNISFQQLKETELTNF